VEEDIAILKDVCSAERLGVYLEDSINELVKSVPVISIFLAVNSRRTNVLGPQYCITIPS
jgi:hypothetical protein